MPRSVSILEAHSGSVKGLHIEARSGDPSTVAVASTLASLSNFQKEPSLLPPSSQNGKDVKQSSEMPRLPAADGVADKHDLDTEMKDASDHSDLPGVSLCDKTGVISPHTGNENLNLDNGPLDSVDAEIGKISGVAQELRPLLRVLAGSSEFDLSGSISKILEERRGIRELFRDLDPPILTSTRRQAFKDALQQGVLDSKNIEVSFENFPYYLR